MEPEYPTFIQVVNSRNPKSKWYGIYKKVLEDTKFLPDNTNFKTRWWYVQNHQISPILCLCGCENPIKTPWKTKFLQGHSNRSDVVKQIKKDAIQKKYGVDNVSKIQEVKDKKKETTLKSIGVTSPFDRTFMEPIWIEKYGVDNPSKIPEVQEKIQKWHKENQKHLVKERTEKFLQNFFNKLTNNTRLENFKLLFTKDDYKGVNAIYDFECISCGNITKSNLDDGKIPRCFTCHPKIESGGQSIIEKELIDYCKTFGFKIIEQTRDVISPMELDVYIPELSVAIELDGLYYHSDKMGKTKWYHSQKTKLCEDLGIQLIHIFEDEWKEKNKICKSRLKHIFKQTSRKIYARKCEVKEIDTETKSKFLRKYHIQGNDKSKVSLGLYYKSHLVSVMTFSATRQALGYKNQKIGECELARYCTIFNFTVIGGAGKLLSYFEKTYTPSKLISYADRRWSIGNLYKSLNFELKGITVPNYWYVINDTRKHRFGFQKHLLKDKLVTYNHDLTENENMILNGYTRIWDCGHYKFIKTYNQ